MTKRELFSLCLWRHCSLLLSISYGIIERLTRIFFLFQHFLHKSQYHLTQPKESCTIQRWHIIIFLKNCAIILYIRTFSGSFLLSNPPRIWASTNSFIEARTAIASISRSSYQKSTSISNLLFIPTYSNTGWNFYYPWDPCAKIHSIRLIPCN